MAKEDTISCEPKWEVISGDPGTEVGEYFNTIDEVMEYCGRILYGNLIFTVAMLRISNMEHARDDKEYEFPEREGKKPMWVMRSYCGDHERQSRWFDHSHELFSMLLAELRQGATFIKACQDTM